MDELVQLARKLGTPGAQKLWQAARKEKIAVTKEQVRRFVATRGQKQIFKPLPRAQGKTASEQPDFRMQMDLIDYKNNPSKGYKNVLVLVDVFSRQAWARLLRSKEPATVAPVLASMIEALPRAPAFIFSDQGNEFTGKVNAMLEGRHIIHRMKSDKNDVNALSVCDRIVQNLKTRIAESLSEEPGEWSDRLASAVAAYNATPHETMHGEAPEEVRGNRVVQFMTLQDNTKKLKHNQNLLESRKKSLNDAGAFRRPLGGLTAFKRGFKATWGEVEKPEYVRGSVVTPQGEGGKVDIKRVMPVDKDSNEAQPVFNLSETERTLSKKQKLWDLMVMLWEFLGDEEKSTAAAAQHLKGRLDAPEYTALLNSVGIHHLSDAVRLFPEFDLTKGGYYITRAT